MLQTRSSETSSPAGHDCLGRLPQLGSARHVLPQQIPGRNLGNAVVFHDSLGLSALSGTRWSEQHHGTHCTRGFLRHRLAKASRPQSPRRPSWTAEVQQPLHFRNCKSYRPQNGYTAAAADTTTARRKSVIVAHDQLRLDLRAPCPSPRPPRSAGTFRRNKTSHPNRWSPKSASCRKTGRLVPKDG